MPLDRGNPPQNPNRMTFQRGSILNTLIRLNEMEKDLVSVVPESVLGEGWMGSGVSHLREMQRAFAHAYLETFPDAS